MIMLTSFVAFRQTYLYIVSNYISNTILPIAMGFPAGWVLAAILTMIYYKLSGLEPKKKDCKNADSPQENPA